MLLGAISNTLGQFRQALGALEPHAENSQDPGLLFTLADAYLGSRKFRSASQLLDQHATLLKGSDGARFHNLSAEIDQSLRDLPAARTHYEAALAAEPGHVKARLGIAGLELASNNRGTAQDMLGTILQEHPSNIDALIARARFALQSDDVDAESSLSSALASLPNTDIFTPQRIEILVALKNVLTQQGRTSEALTYSEMLSEAFPGSLETESAMRDAVALFEEGRLDEARAALTKLQEDNPGVAAAATLLDVINFMQGNNEVASEPFEQVLDPETAPSRTLQIYAMNEMHLNQPERVLDALRDTINDATDANLVGLYGVAAISAGEPDEGLNSLRRAVELDPEKARFRLLQARYFNTKADPEPEQALEEIEAAAAISPGDPFVQAALLEQLGLMNRLDEADKRADAMLQQDVAPVLSQIEREARPGETITPFMVLAEYYARNGDDKATDRMLALANDETDPRRTLNGTRQQHQCPLDL